MPNNLQEAPATRCAARHPRQERSVVVNSESRVLELRRQAWTRVRQVEGGAGQVLAHPREEAGQRGNGGIRKGGRGLRRRGGWQWVANQWEGAHDPNAKLNALA